MKIVLTLVAALSLAACGGSSPSAGSTVTVTSTPSATATATPSASVGAPGTLPADWTWSPAVAGIRFGYPRTWQSADAAAYDKNLPQVTRDAAVTKFVVKSPNQGGLLAVSQGKVGKLKLETARTEMATLGTVSELTTPVGPGIATDIPIGKLSERIVVVQADQEVLMFVIAGPSPEKVASFGDLLANSFTKA